MAFPSVTSRTPSASSTTNATSYTPTLPGSPAYNSLLVAFVSSDGNPTLSTKSPGWQQLTGQATNSTIVTQAVFWKIAGASNTLVVDSTASEQYTAIIYEVAGSNLFISGTTSNGSSTNSDPPNHNPAVTKDYLWLASRGGDSTVVATAAPTNYSSLQTQAAAGTGGASTNVAERQLNASSENPGTFTSASEQWGCWTVAIWESPRTGAWLPTDLRSVTLEEWFDASDYSSITESGGAVSQWNDKSGNARNATQATGSLKPTYLATGFNSSYPCISGDGTEGLSYSGKVSLRRFSIQTFSTQLSMFHTGAGGNHQALLDVADMRVEHVYTHTWTATTYSTKVDGNADRTNSAFTDTHPTPGAFFTACRFDALGGGGGSTMRMLDGLLTEIAGSPTTNAVDGVLSQWILVSGYITPEDTERLEAYIAHKVGLQGNLPSGNTYKSAPPVWDAVGSASGTGTATGVGLAGPLGSDGAASGTGTATGVGQSTASSSGSASGTGSAPGVGNALANAVGLAAGIAAAAAIGLANFAGVGAASGQGDASGVGVAAAYATGSASATGSGSAAGASTAESVAASTGTGTGAGVGASTAEASGSAAGVGTGAGVGNASATTVGASTGQGAATGVGASTAQAVGSASGVGAASGVSDSISSGEGIGSAAGTGSGAAVGASTAEAVGSASATSTGPGVGASNAAASGSASGVGSASGAGTATFVAQGAASGSGQATGAGSATAAGVGLGAANGAAAAAGVADFQGAGSAASTSTAAATGASTAAGAGEGQGLASGLGVAEARTEASGASAGVGSGVGVAATTVDAVGQATTSSTAAAVGRDGAIVIITPPERVLTALRESRVLTIPAETRVLTTLAERRILTVEE